MKMNLIRKFISLALLFLCVSSQASEINHIFEAVLPVASQEKQIRQTAFEKALMEVSIRVSGNSATPTLIDLNQASRMVRQYRYKALSQAEVDAFVKKFTEREPPKFNLWIQFDDSKVKKLLRENGLPIWGYQRPNVLVWLAVKDGPNRYILKKSDQSQIKDALTQEAKYRGLPLIWPELDARDKQVLSFIDIWGEFWEPVKSASRRYPVDAVILGRMKWSNGGWHVNWSLLMEGKIENWQLDSQQLNILSANGIGVATDHISSRFAVFVDSDKDEELLLRVSDLDSVKKYAAASHYLSSLAPVKNIYAAEIHPQYVDFRIELTGDEGDLKRIIALGKILLPDTGEANIRADAKKTSENPSGGTLTLRPADSKPSLDEASKRAVHRMLPPPNILRYRLSG